MRNALLFVLLASVGARAAAAPIALLPYDAALAQRLGADERGMKSYVLVILKTEAKQAASDGERASVFKGHMANIKRLAAEGKLVVAGPFEENERHYEGIFIFNVTKIAEAQALLATDPAVANGLLAFEAYGWYGSAALQETAAIHSRIDKSSR